MLTIKEIDNIHLEEVRAVFVHPHGDGAAPIQRKLARKRPQLSDETTLPSRRDRALRLRDGPKMMTLSLLLLLLGCLDCEVIMV